MLAPIASLVLLAFAVSLDGFGVGMTYGVRKIRIPVGSILIISLCSGLVILLSMLVGRFLTSWMSPHGASAVGACILIGIGIWALIQFGRGGESADNENGMSVRSRTANGTEPNSASAAASQVSQRTVWTLEIRQWGIIIQILRRPSAADVDRSGIITTGEALLLGTALSLDAFGAGIGAALVGYPPVLTACLIAAASGSFLRMGTQIGFRVAGWRWMKQLTLLPGIMLITIGLLKLL
jgi:putative Mn2+ efflux pump MntP